MIFRHLSEIGTSISLESELHRDVDLHPTPRRITMTDLKDPARYALVAWGIAEKIRLHRELANLRVTTLARACGIDPSHLSRIENADTNVSLENLVVSREDRGILAEPGRLGATERCRTSTRIHMEQEKNRAFQSTHCVIWC